MSEESGKVFLDYSHKDGPRIIQDPDHDLIHNTTTTTTTSFHHESNLLNSNNQHYMCKTSRSSSKTSTPTSSSSSLNMNNKSKLMNQRHNSDDDSYELPSHYSQPWYYSHMTREEAQQYLEKYGIIDGVFLVRQSNRNPSCFVLSFVFNWKVHHVQIMPVEEKGQTVLSLDCGKTKFYDLLQLIEFYQLNVGILPTKLTHFLVHPKYHHTNHTNIN